MNYSYNPQKTILLKHFAALRENIDLAPAKYEHYYSKVL